MKSIQTIYRIDSGRFDSDSLHGDSSSSAAASADRPPAIKDSPHRHPQEGVADCATGLGARTIRLCQTPPRRLPSSQPARQADRRQRPQPAVRPTAAPTLKPEQWKTLPVIPTVSDSVTEIYQRGIEMGNNPHAFSKIGDCGSTPAWFLGDFDRGPRYYRLGDYQAARRRHPMVPGLFCPNQPGSPIWLQCLGFVRAALG